MTRESTISDLKDAIRRLEVRKREIDRQYDALVATLGYFENPEAPETLPEQDATHPETSMGDAMEHILGSESPLHRREIYNRLLDMGVPVRGQRPIDNVSAHLSHDARFETLGDGRWALANAPSNGVEADGDSNEAEDDVAW